MGAVEGKVELAVVKRRRLPVVLVVALEAVLGEVQQDVVGLVGFLEIIGVAIDTVGLQRKELNRLVFWRRAVAIDTGCFGMGPSEGECGGGVVKSRILPSRSLVAQEAVPGRPFQLPVQEDPVLEGFCF